MARKMKDLTFREEQYNNRYSPHIRPINEFVDALSDYPNSWVPYVAPLYGGTNAKLLSILRDPGPKTQIEGGSGFICLENDDPTAELMCDMFERHNISPSASMLWNIYPWYINQKPSAKQVNVGVDVLADLLKLLPKLEVVMTHGGDAKKGWKKLIKKYPEISQRKLIIIETYHTSRQAFWHKDPAISLARKSSLNNAFLECSSVLNG